MLIGYHDLPSPIGPGIFVQGFYSVMKIYLLVAGLHQLIANEIYIEGGTSIIALFQNVALILQMYGSSSLTGMMYGGALEAGAIIMNFGRLTSLAVMFKLKK